jgi:UPF0176 protein
VGKQQNVAYKPDEELSQTKRSMEDYLILLYYCYSPIEDVELFRKTHHQFCIDHKLLGRIIVAKEGINGSVSGLKADCEKYMAHLKADPRFSHIQFKIEPHHAHAFQKLHVRVKNEIVHSGLRHIDPNKKTGRHIEPEDFRKLKDQEDVVIVDVRSDYESAVGKFKDAITLDIANFRDFPAKVNELEPYKGKKIITYCTGGIKCEKASAYLLEKGFKNVSQLHGGIINYSHETGGEDFEGKCYVFDNRIVADVNRINPSVISKCHICHAPSDRMVNCANPGCNKHVPICESCSESMAGACSEACKSHPKKRPYDGKGSYPKKLNGYNPRIGAERLQ